MGSSLPRSQMPYDYEAELAAWRTRYAAKQATRVWRPAPGQEHMHGLRHPEPARVEYDGDQMPRYEDESQEAA